MRLEDTPRNLLVTQPREVRQSVVCSGEVGDRPIEFHTEWTNESKFWHAHCFGVAGPSNSWLSDAKTLRAWSGELDDGVEAVGEAAERAHDGEAGHEDEQGVGDRGGGVPAER